MLLRSLYAPFLKKNNTGVLVYHRINLPSILILQHPDKVIFEISNLTDSQLLSWLNLYPGLPPEVTDMEQKKPFYNWDGDVSKSS